MRPKTHDGRKFRMAYTALWILGGITAVLTLSFLFTGHADHAARIAQVGLGAVGTLLSVYMGGQAWVDRYHGETNLSGEQDETPDADEAPEPDAPAAA